MPTKVLKSNASPMQKVIKITCPPEERYRKVLKFLSTLMPAGISDKEIDIICALFELGCVLTTQSRKLIRKKLNISVEYMNNYVCRLREKGIIVKDRLHESLSSIDVSDRSKPYFILFEFQTDMAKSAGDREGKKEM